MKASFKRCRCFQPIELNIKIESLEELVGLHRLVGATIEDSCPGSRELWEVLEEIIHDSKV